MIPAAFEYSRPASLDEALKILAGGDAGTKVIAGGHSLLPLLKLRVASVERLVDVGRLRELQGIRRSSDGGWTIGAGTTYRDLLDSQVAHSGALGDALPIIGDVQVRNRGTIGGAIAHADPASDVTACLLALDAQIVARSSSGERVLPVDGFFTGPFETGLKPDELLVEIRIPAAGSGSASAYSSIQQAASGYPLVGVAAWISRGEGKKVGAVRVGVTGVATHAYRAKAVESALSDAEASPSALAAAAEHACEGQEVNADMHADQEYRTAMAAVYTRRALEAAWSRLG